MVIVARRRFVNGILAVGVLLAGTACTDLDQASAAGVGPADAVAQLAAQLADSADATYTATYSLTGGDTATVSRAQDPPRTAYRWPGGRLILTATGTTRCAKATCAISDPGGPAPEPPPAAGLISPEGVMAMLRSAEADPALRITQRDTTLAERHASCLQIVGSFEVCVAGDGTLAAFKGNLGGLRVEMTLTDLTSTTAVADFRPPPGATVTDQRPK
ncbi:hypothetical protein ACWT_0814 [Actinoplanes sp. SE50]|nr:hypothetical protein ACPL_931 [Actinoplanes sp. SE50/110]ATO80229.1 hypothetical protein ACWT_0814 [Actinoplanes sp. SE50]SLL97634.1 hypothetical protein ACSP50_0841 [Actinoplanes sp. SE50/110]